MKSEFVDREKVFLRCMTAIAVILLSSSWTNALDVCANIASNTTWTTANSPYVLKSGSTGCTVTVNAGVTLTIQAGVQVKGISASNLVINGTLSAIGTSGSPIIFTTNSGTPAPGQWGGLRFGSGAGPSASQITYAAVSYAGNQASFPGAIYINGSSPTFNNVTVNYSSRSGVQITGAAATPTFTNATISNNSIYGLNLVSSGGINITSSTISNNTDYALGAQANTRLLGLTGLTISGNGSGSKNSIGYRGGAITVTNETWLSPVPWTVTATTIVNSGKTLTVNAGTTVKFASNTGIDVIGKLTAVGISGSLITFTSNSATPAPGNWRAIRFRPGCNAASQISYSTVSYGGATYADGVQVDSCSPTLSNVTVSNSSGSGIVVSGAAASPSLTNVTVTGNNQYGISLLSGAVVTITNSTLSNNADYAIRCVDGTRILGLTGMTIIGNGGGNKNAVDYDSRFITTAETFGPVVWDVNGGLYIDAAGTLTIAAGATVRIAAGASFEVVGKLSAIGTSINPIQFTSSNPVPGGWAGIIFWPESNPTSEIRHASVSYGGQGGFWSSTLFIFDSSPTLNYVTVSDSSTAGIEIWGAPANPSMSNLTLINNGTFGLDITDFVNVNVNSATITGNQVGVRVMSASPTLNNVEVSDSSSNGIEIIGSTSNPVMSNLTLSENGGFGITVGLESGINLTNSTISNNSDFAIRAEANTRLLGLTGLTISGNGGGTKDGIGYFGGGITTNEVWRPGATWVMVGDPWVEQSGYLAIQAGVTVKFNGNGLSVNGKLTATGTAESPILFTSNQQSPAAGDWGGIVFWSTSNAASEITYATISYTGNNWVGGVYIDGAAAKLDHVNITHSAGKAVKIVGTSTSVISNCSFINNAEGVVNENPSNAIMAKLNFWNSDTGPSGAGPGSGQSVSAGVVYLPWLASAPTAPHFFKTESISDLDFNPAVGQTTTIDFESSLSGNWTLTIFNSADQIVRSFSGSGTIGSIVWDGKNQSGQVQDEGQYRIDLESTSGIYTAAKARALVRLGPTPVFHSLTANPYYFTPNGDGQNDTTTINATFNFSQPTWTLNFKNSVGTVVFSRTNLQASLPYAWNGKDANQVLQPSGVYTVELIASAQGEQTTGSIFVTLDTTGRTSYIITPYYGQTLSNVYGWFIDIVGTVNEINLSQWKLEIGSGPAPSSWTNLATGTTNVTNQVLYALSVMNYTNGTYSLRLTATRTDLTQSVHTILITIGNFKAEVNVNQIDRRLSQVATITSYVPFTLNETLTIKNLNGQVIKTLFTGQRTAGTYNDTWTGLNTQGQMVPDAMHFFTATVIAGQSVFYWGGTTDTSTEWIWSHTQTGTFDPFNNQLLALPYTFWFPGSQTTFTFGTECWFDPGSGWHVVPGCNPPNFCVTLDGYREAAPNQTFYWSGTDQEGRFRDDVCGWAVIRLRAKDWNMILPYGTKPVISNLQINPPLYAPAVGTQTVSFTFSTYQNQTATVTVEFLNQNSLSKLRTITQNNVTPGNINIGWDGRANNGMWVAPGHYTVIVKVTDSMGNSTVESRILTTIQH